MKLLLDLQAIQGPARHRGLGRYSLELAAAVAARPEVTGVTVLLNGGLGGTSLVEDRVTLQRRIPQADVVVFEAPWPWRTGDWRDVAAHHRAEAVRDQCIQQIDPDAVIVCSLFSWANHSVLSVPAAPDRPFTAVVAYDFLPLTDEDSRLSDEDGPWFADRMESLARADLLLNISDFTSAVVHELLGERCPPRVTIWGSSFTLPQVKPAPRRGVIVAGGDGRRKNEASTIRAFAQLPQKLRRAHPLTVVGRQSHPDLLASKVAHEVGLDPAEYTVLGGEVSDEELAVLYAHARLVVMPSRGEGLGMPVLEAWHYGTPAVTSDVTSLPELLADDRYTFPPDDHAAQARVLQRLLGDDAEWDAAVAHAASRAHLFTWERAAEIAVTSIEQALASAAAARTAGPKPSLAFVTPWPPAESSAAARSQEVAQGLGAQYDVTIVGTGALPYEEFREREGDFDRVLALVGDDPSLFGDAVAAVASGRCTVIVDGSQLPHADGDQFIESGLAGLLDLGRPLDVDVLRRAQAVVVSSQALADRLTAGGGVGLPRELVTVVDDGDPAAIADAVERGHRRFHVPASRHLADPRQRESVAANRPDRTSGTIYVDVSSLIETDRQTGIERVSASLCTALAQAYPGRVFPVHAQGDRFALATPVIPRLLEGSDHGLGTGLPVRFRPGDVLFSPENKRDLGPWAELVNSVRGRGAAYVQLIHDLLPIRLEDFFLPFAKPWYEQWMRLIADTADIAVCNSQATMADFQAWLSEAGGDRDLGSRTRWLRLASTLGGSPLVTPELRLRPRGAKRVLAVGTIEPRKAYDTLLAAAQALWRQGEDVELVIVGRPGWVGAELLDRLRAAQSPGRLTWLRDASDLDLQWEYLTADLLVMASRAEGFGLPIVEAIAHGVPVLARDLPVFREILGPDGQYFVLDRELPDAILDALRSDAPAAHLPDRIVGWQETAGDLLAALDGLGAQPRF